MVPQFLTALDREQAEFVGRHWSRDGRACGERRCCGDDRRGCVRPCCARSPAARTCFRSAVIEALGDYKAQYAVDALAAVAKLDGPLQDDARWRWEDRRQACFGDAGGHPADGAAADATVHRDRPSASSGSTASRMRVPRRHAEVSRTMNSASRSCCAAPPQDSPRSPGGPSGAARALVEIGRAVA